MKNKEVLELQKELSGLNLKGVKFAYAVARNLQIIKPIAASLQKSVEPNEGYKLYEKERVELAKTHSEKDEKNKPVMEKTPTGSRYKIADEEAFDKDFEALKEKHKEAIKDREAQAKEFEELLEKDVDITLFKIKLDDVPSDITTKQMNGIIAIVDEE